MKRLSVTVTDQIQRTVDELGLEGRLRLALEEWYGQRGEEIDLRSESARLRAMLDVANFTVRSWALEVGYEHMASWHNERSEAERDAWLERRERSAQQWAAQDEAEGADEPAAARVAA